MARLVDVEMLRQVTQRRVLEGPGDPVGELQQQGFERRRVVPERLQVEHREAFVQRPHRVGDGIEERRVAPLLARCAPVGPAAELDPKALGQVPDERAQAPLLTRQGQGLADRLIEGLLLQGAEPLHGRVVVGGEKQHQ